MEPWAREMHDWKIWCEEHQISLDSFDRRLRGWLRWNNERAYNLNRKQLGMAHDPRLTVRYYSTKAEYSLDA